MMQLKSLSAGLALMGASVATTFAAPSALAQNDAWGYELQGQVASYQALRSETPSGSLAGQTSVQALLSNLPDMLQVSYGGFTSESGGDVANDVTIAFTLPDDITIGINIGELRVYGLDDGEVANLSNNVTAELGSRIDMRNVSLIGIETLAEVIAEEVSDTTTGLLPDEALEAGAGDTDFALNSYEYSMGHIVLDGFVWHATSDEVNAGIDALFAGLDGQDEADAWPLFAPLARFYRSIEIADYAIYDTRFAMDMDIADGEMNQNMVMDMDVALSAGSGWNRGDFDFVLSEGTTYEIAMTIDAEEMSQPMSFNMGGSYALNTMSDMHLSTLMGYLERQEVPDVSVEDLMSLGTFENFDAVSTINGITITSVGRSAVDLSEWNWFVPENIAFEAQDFEYNIGGYVDFISSFIGSIPEVQEDEEAVEIFGMFDDVRAALVSLDMDVINMDMAARLNWDADTGATGFEFANEADGFGSMSMGFAGYLPSYREFVVAIEDAEKNHGGDDKDNEYVDPVDIAIEELIEAEMTLTSFDFNIDDDGGLDKVFGLAIAIAQLAPEDSSEAAMIRNASPSELRALLSGLTRMGGMEVAQVYPPGVAYVNGVADFIMNGGALRVALNPEQPIGADSEEQMMQLGDPQAILDYLGFEFEYTAP